MAVHGRLDATGSVPLSEQRIHLKPHGLWYACGTGWIDYAARVFNQVDPYVYGIDVNLSGMRVIRTNEELAAFTDEFGATRYTGDGPGEFIDWTRVAARYTGIEICPRLGGMRWFAGTDWYHGWDVASGCIWTASAVVGWTELASGGNVKTSITRGAY